MEAKITALAQLNSEAQSKVEFYSQMLLAQKAEATDAHWLSVVPTFYNRSNEPMNIDDIHFSVSVVVHKFLKSRPQPENINPSNPYSPLAMWQMDFGREKTLFLDQLNATPLEKNNYRSWVNSRAGNSWAQLGQELLKVAGLATVVVGGVTAASSLTAAAGAATGEGALAGSVGLLGESAPAVIPTLPTAGLTLAQANTPAALAIIAEAAEHGADLIQPLIASKVQNEIQKLVNPKNNTSPVVQQEEPEIIQPKSKAPLIIGFGIVLILALEFLI